MALWAHARLLSSVPASGGSYSISPAEIRLTFSERPEIALASIVLVGGGDSTALAPIRRDSSDENTVVAPVGRTLASGSYRVVWRVAARDGHPIRGAYTFTVTTAADGADTAAPAPVTGTPLIDEQESVTPAVAGALGSIFIRWLAFISVFLAIGSVVFRRFVILPGAPDTFSHIALSPVRRGFIRLQFHAPAPNRKRTNTSFKIRTKP